MQTLFSRSGEPHQPNSTFKGKPVLIRRRKCTRCGGMGGADAWKHTGWTCYRCGGNCWDPNDEIIKLYTPEQNAKLNLIADKKQAKKAAARAEAARLEQERRDRERHEIISANAGFIARINEELSYGEIEVLVSIRDRMVEQAKEPTERQVEVVNQIIERNTAERARRAGARHVGDLKERRDFTLTLLYTRSDCVDNYPVIWSHWSLFVDENGCKIACKSAPWTLGLKRDPDDRDVYLKGQTIRVKATVVKHEIDKKGEPITYINRPKEIAA
jgi:hypothetical protein